MSSTRNTAAAATALVAAAALLLLGPAQAAEGPDTTPPQGSVSGLRSPAKGTLEFYLSASDTGSGLAGAEATLSGESDSVSLSGNSVSAVPLSLDTTTLSDGDHELTVRVTDAAGNAATLLDRQIAVRNAPIITGSRASVTIGVSSDSAGSSGNGGGKGGGKGKGGGNGKGNPKGPPCLEPRIKMRLVARPLWRTRPGKLPVVRFKKRHLYKGWLTCRRGGRRALAPPGARVEIFYRIWRRSFRKRRGPIRVRKGATRVRRNQRLWVKLGFLSGRTIIFRYRSPTGQVARTKLRIAIARTDPPRRGQ